MFTTLIVAALASTAVKAAPVRRDQPTGWATGYLENYDTYHTRYLALSCETQHNTTFFEDCCHPLLATENLEDDRAPYCTPNTTEIASAASYTATATATDSADAEAATEFCEATASVESVYSSLVEASAITTVDTASITATSTSSAEWDDATSTSSSSMNQLASALVAENNVAYKHKSSSSSSATPTSTWVAPTSTSTWVEPTTTSTSTAAATTTASGGSGSTQTGGYATYFYQGGNAGACGTVHSDSDYGIAIDANGWWPNYNSGGASPYCGKQIVITNTNNGKSVTATVWDVCPTCTNDNSLDLSVGAFTAIASESDGMVPISWQWA